MATNETSTAHKVEEFAEDLGRLLGTARAKADSWMGQRQSIVATLTSLRDEATKLLAELGHGAQSIVATSGEGTDEIVEGVLQPQPGQRRRRMSKAARAAISAAQKARWAKQRTGEK
jgi:hypothetical protein